MIIERAWHFVGHTLRNGDPVPPDGKWLVWKGPCVMCESGLHASRNPFDALQYAPGATLCLVDVAQIQAEQSDKLVCRKRRIIVRMDATEMLRYFARQQALSVIHLWDAPDIVCDYLMTGDERVRDAARNAAWDAACAAPWDAARTAAWDAAWDAAGAAAWYAARAAAWDAARAAACAAARAAAWYAARDAAWDAARNEFTQLVYECLEDFL